jgi:hypothetical protein
MGCEKAGKEVKQMHFKKYMVVGTAALAVLGSVTGAALASNRGAKAPAKPAISVPKTADTDNIQEGDQNSPDNPSMAPEAAAVATSVAASAKSASVKSSKSGAAPSESGGEGSGESENSGESDGPGGHQDPPGDVNHEFDGEE